MKQLYLIVLMALLHPTDAFQQPFDPATDPVAGLDLTNHLRLIVPEQVLIRSACSVTPELSDVTTVTIGEIHDKPFLFLKGTFAEDREKGCTLMIPLLENGKGLWIAGQTCQICSGNACNTCGFDEYWGCSCERYTGADLETESMCNHTVSTGPGLGRVD